MALDTCVYTCLIDRPASVPIDESLFLHRLISSIDVVSILLLSASMVAPRLGLLLRLNSPMKTAVVNNSRCIFFPYSSKFMNMGSQYPMIALLPLYLANKKSLYCFSNSNWRQSIQLIHLLVGITLFDWSANGTQCHYMLFPPLRYSLECHHHMRDAMIPSFLPEHVQALNYNQGNVLP